MAPPRSNLGDYLAPLQDYFAHHQVIPSITELAALWKLEARSWAYRLVQRLKDEGYLEDTPGRRLRPGARFFERAIADTVRAGLPASANDRTHESISIDRYLIDKPSETELFQVRGDSMIEAGIHEGDFVVIERRAAARPGEIVLAYVDGEFTLKTLARDAQGYWLEAANPAYAPIRPREGLEIHGVMVGLFRKTAAAAPGVVKLRGRS